MVKASWINWCRGQIYPSKDALKEEIKKRAALFISEFSAVAEEDKDRLVEGLDRTPAQMIAYQLGWLRLLAQWEADEKAGKMVVTPHPDYKWNQLGGLYQAFYQECADLSLLELQEQFQQSVEAVLEQIDSYTDEELFQSDQRRWASSTPSRWPIWKWIHIHTVAPFQTFRTKIRKWKKEK